jgi:hypothetical protein
MDQLDWRGCSGSAEGRMCHLLLLASTWEEGEKLFAKQRQAVL